MISARKTIYLFSLTLIILALSAMAGYGELFAIILIACMPIIVYVLLTKTGRKYFDAFSPIFVFPAAFSMVYGIGALQLIYNLAGPEFSDHAYVYSTQLVFYPLLGIAVYYVAVLSVSKLQLSSLSIFNHDIDHFSAKISFWLLLLISIIAAGYMVHKVGLPFLYEDKLEGRISARENVTSYVVYLIRVSFVGFFIYVTSVFHKYKTTQGLGYVYWLFLIGALLVIIGINMIPGWRAPIFLFLLNAFIIFHYKYYSLDFKKSIFYGGILIVFVLIWGYIRIITYPENIDSISELKQITGSNFLTFLVWATQQFAPYAFGFHVVLEQFSTGGMHFMHGGVYGLTLSTIAPGKQQTLGEVLKGQSGLDFAGGGINPTLLGDAYADAGLAGIVIYMAVIGIIIGMLYRVMRANRSVISVLIYSYATACLVLGVLTGIMSQAIYSFHLFVLLFVLSLIVLSGKVRTRTS